MPNIKEIDRVIRLLTDATGTTFDGIGTAPYGQKMDALRVFLNPFNMSFFSIERRAKGHKCRTPCCIAGWACAKPVAGYKWQFEVDTSPEKSTSQHAANILGLDSGWAHDNLFVPENNMPLEKVTKQQAIAALERLKKAGDKYQKLNAWTLWGMKQPRVPK